MLAKGSSWQRLYVASSLVSEPRVPHYQDEESSILSSLGKVSPGMAVGVSQESLSAAAPQFEVQRQV